MGALFSGPSAMMEKQIKHQQEMQERQMAMMIAKSRDTCLWFTAFYATVATGLVTGYRKSRKPFLIAPLVPLTFALLYYWDLAYGTKIRRIKHEAGQILSFEADMLGFPRVVTTQSSNDVAGKEDSKKPTP